MGRKPLPVPDDLNNTEKSALIVWCQKNHPTWAYRNKLKWVVGETLDYWGARENPHSYKNWLRVVQNRIRWLDARGVDPFDRQSSYRAREYPQERGARGTGPVALGDVIDIKKYRQR